MSYSDTPQKPGQYQDAVLQGGNIYDEVDAKRFPNGYVCGIALIPLAYIICAYMITEGLLIILHGITIASISGPFKDSESGFLYVVAWGDLVAAVIGLFGVWFSHNLMPIGWRSTSKMHGSIATVGVGTLLVWRTLVCLAFAPWAGILLAFSPASSDKALMTFLVCVYIAWSIFIVYSLIMIFRQAVSDGKRFQRHLDIQANHERQQLLISAGNWRQDNVLIDGEDIRDHEVEPEVFGVLPLADAVTLYAVVIAVACVWSFIHLIVTGHTMGGWLFFASTPAVSSTFWLEAFLYPFSFLIALIGLAGASSLSGSDFLTNKPATSSLLIFLLGSLFRYALLFAVTGMDLLEKDTCGFYLHGAVNFANKDPWSKAGGSWIHCQPTSVLTLLGMVAFCILDAYLIWATFQLWHHSQDWEFRPIEGKNMGDYGAAPQAVEDDGS